MGKVRCIDISNVTSKQLLEDFNEGWLYETGEDEKIFWVGNRECDWELNKGRFWALTQTERDGVFTILNSCGLLFEVIE